MAAETSSPSLRHTDADVTAWLAKRAEFNKGLAGANVQGDAFAQVFASAHEKKDVPPAPEPATSDAAPHSPPENSAPQPQHHGWAKGHHHHAVHEKHDNDNRKAEETTKAAPEETTADTTPATPACAEKAAKPCEDATKEKDSTNALDDTTSTPNAAGAIESSALETPAADPSVQDAPDDAPKAVFCLNPALQAQEAKETSGTDGEKEEKNSKEGKTAQNRLGNLPDLLSFRANIKTGVETPGEKPDGTAAAGDVKAGQEQPKTTDLTLKATADVPIDATAQLLVDDNAGKDKDFSSLMRDMPLQKKEAGLEKPAAAPNVTFDANVKGDAPVSQSPTAAGSRLSAQLGFSAPTLNGSGGGSPPPVNGGEIQPTSGVGVNAAAATNALENGAPVQMTRAPRGMANLPPSEQIGLTLTRMAKNGVTKFDLQLHPADLGKVDIRLEIGKDGLVRATLTTDNPTTYAILQKDSGGLEKILQQAGLQTDMNSLNFSLRDQAQSQQQEAFQNSPGWKRWAENVDTIEQGTEAETSAWVAGPGRVDLMI